MVYSPRAMRGELSEWRAKEPFIRAGYLVYDKAAPGPVDFIVLHPETGEVCKVEVKTVQAKSRPVLTANQAVCADIVAAVEPGGGVTLFLPGEPHCKVSHQEA